MGRNSVLGDNALPSVEALKSYGRAKLIELQNEAAERLANQARVYGPTYRPGRQQYMQSCLEDDIRRIREALLALDRAEGVEYEPRVQPASREEIAERLVSARRNSLLHRNDEGTDHGDSLRASEELRSVRQLAQALEARGFPITAAEEHEAQARIDDRRTRMLYGARHLDRKTVCTTCWSSTFLDSRHCLKCGRPLREASDMDVFVSYASEDKAWVKGLANELKKRRVEAWVDDRELVPGEELSQQIKQQIELCTTFAFVVSGASIAKEWPLRELAAAVHRRETGQSGFRIVPIYLARAAGKLPPGVEGVVGVKAHIDDNPADFRDPGFLDEVVRALRGIPIDP